jgi:hypothetical protein
MVLRFSSIAIHLLVLGGTICFVPFRETDAWANVLKKILHSGQHISILGLRPGLPNGGYATTQIGHS